jgi:hypothetical protein
MREAASCRQNVGRRAADVPKTSTNEKARSTPAIVTILLDSQLLSTATEYINIDRET